MRFPLKNQIFITSLSIITKISWKILVIIYFGQLLQNNPIYGKITLELKWKFQEIKTIKRTERENNESGNSRTYSG